MSWSVEHALVQPLTQTRIETVQARALVEILTLAAATEEAGDISPATLCPSRCHHKLFAPGLYVRGGIVVVRA